MNDSTVASDGRLTAVAETGLSATFAVFEDCAPARPHVSRKITIDLRKGRMVSFQFKNRRLYVKLAAQNDRQ
jgi:hypothetical protein